MTHKEINPGHPDISIKPLTPLIPRRPHRLELDGATGISAPSAGDVNFDRCRRIYSVDSPASINLGSLTGPPRRLADHVAVRRLRDRPSLEITVFPAILEEDVATRWRRVDVKLTPLAASLILVLLAAGRLRSGLAVVTDRNDGNFGALHRNSVDGILDDAWTVESPCASQPSTACEMGALLTTAVCSGVVRVRAGCTCVFDDTNYTVLHPIETRAATR